MSRIISVLLAASLAACGDDISDDDNLPDAGGAPSVAQTYSAIVLASYEDSLEAAKQLDAAISELLDDPSEATLDDARQAWRDAREPYLQTETFRFYEGPIDNEEQGLEGLINAWPLDENYIDYVEGDADAGIINDTSISIGADELIALNTAGGEENIATGFHAIEFLLWGQDFSDDGPGDRPYTDFVEGSGGTAENQARRGEYLRAVSALLVDNLQQLVDAWSEDDPKNYRAEFEALDEDEALDHILTGMITLSGFETGGERLQTALDTADQEDEHSCFSDNTHRDMVQDVRGIQNVYLGRYKRTDGTTVSGDYSVRDAVAAKDEELAKAVEDRIAESLQLAENLMPPFDQEIKLENEEGRARVTALVTSLKDQEDILFDVFDKFDLTVTLPE